MPPRPPRKILESRFSESASEAVLGQKQSRNTYTAGRALHTVFAWTFANLAYIKFPPPEQPQYSAGTLCGRVHLYGAEHETGEVHFADFTVAVC